MCPDCSLYCGVAVHASIVQGPIILFQCHYLSTVRVDKVVSGFSSDESSHLHGIGVASLNVDSHI